MVRSTGQQHQCPRNPILSHGIEWAIENLGNNSSIEHTEEEGREELTEVDDGNAGEKALTLEAAALSRRAVLEKIIVTINSRARMKALRRLVRFLWEVWWWLSVDDVWARHWVGDPVEPRNVRWKAGSVVRRRWDYFGEIPYLDPPGCQKVRQRKI